MRTFALGLVMLASACGQSSTRPVESMQGPKPPLVEPHLAAAYLLDRAQRQGFGPRERREKELGRQTPLALCSVRSGEASSASQRKHCSECRFCTPRLNGGTHDGHFCNWPWSHGFRLGARSDESWPQGNGMESELGKDFVACNGWGHRRSHSFRSNRGQSGHDKLRQVAPPNFGNSSQCIECIARKDNHRAFDWRR